MNSRNHMMLTFVSAWMLKRLVGLQLAPGGWSLLESRFIDSLIYFVLIH
jgi:hypothetical protein